MTTLTKQPQIAFTVASHRRHANMALRSAYDKKVKDQNSKSIINYRVPNNLGFMVLDTHTWKPGMYLGLLTNDRKLLGKVKIIIS